MAKRKLTDKEVDEVAKREWKRQPKKLIISTDNPDKVKALQVRLNNLSGPKTEEGKRKAVSNLIVGRHENVLTPNVKHGGYIRQILTTEENEFYMSRRADYERDYDINGSADEILLNLILIDEVIIFRLLKRQTDKPSLDISRPFNEASGRLNKNLENLGMLRKQRLNQDKTDNSITVAALAEMVFRDKRRHEEEKLKDREEEEKYLRELEQRKREKESPIVDAEFNIIEPKSSSSDEEVGE